MLSHLSAFKGCLWASICRVAARVLEWPTFLEMVEHRPDAFQMRQILWHSPGFKVVKLNINGCLKGNPGVSGGGGIIRNSAGNMIFVSYRYLGKCTNLQAKAKALLIGLQLCVQSSFIENLVVESDSLKLIQNSFEDLPASMVHQWGGGEDCASGSGWISVHTLL